MDKIDLKNIKNPDFLKNLSYEELNLLSKDIRDEILDVVSKNGGHLSSNLGAVESTIALCRVFDFTKDKIIFDVGHQCYTYKILTGRDLTSLRKKGGISGFQKIGESAFDCYECGHSSTSISAAMGLASARDLEKEDYSVIAFIGDASFENGLAIEAINNLAKEQQRVIIVFNDNAMSIGQNEGGLSRFFRKLSESDFYKKNKARYERVMGRTRFTRAISKPFSLAKGWLKRHLISPNVFDVLNIEYISNVDGHNIKKIENALKKAKKCKGPVVVRIKTKKGKGIAYTENDKLGLYHGVGPFNKETGEFTKNPTVTSWQEQIANSLEKVFEENKKTAIICPATGLGSDLISIQSKHPERYFDVGICEEHSVVFGAGLSRNGIHPFISMYSTFLQRAYDEISHDLARMNLNSTLLIDRAGLVGNDGETHQGIFDVSFLYTIPNCTITMPSNPSQITSLLKESLNNHGVFAIRYPKESIKVSAFKDKKIKYGEWIEELSGESKIAIVSYGPVIESLKQELKKIDKQVTLFNAVYLRPISDEYIDKLMSFEKIVIYDEYSTQQGFVNEVISRLISKGFNGNIKYFAIPNEFICQGTIKEQKESLGLSIDKVIESL